MVLIRALLAGWATPKSTLTIMRILKPSTEYINLEAFLTELNRWDAVHYLGIAE